MNERPPQVALVVGGSGDIGREVASRLGQLGYRLAITGRTEPRLEEAVGKLREFGADVRGFLCDLTDEEAIAGLFDELGEAYGRLDVLINAAGTAQPRLLIKADRSHFEETLRVNLVGPALVARHGLMLMRKAGRGTIINITSLGGRQGRKGFAAYCASKGALIALSDSLREEAAKFGVRVASVCPDKVDTRMHGDDPERSGMIRPADVAEAVVFLLRLSPAAVVREVRIYNTEP
ncbi:MAG: SDR family oxidoreductase [Candidatus Omnitrophica bacterium]|nr:SDR family oxidoreductase [Candidatus Omnitrophota bacterium]